MGDRRRLWVPAFLAALSECGVITAAAKAAEIDRSAVTRLRQDDPEFDKQCDDAMETAIDALEQEARRRALWGVEEPVIYQGQPTPLYERDAKGEVVMEAFTQEVTLANGDKEMRTGNRPKLRLNPDGSVALLTIRKPSDAMMALLLKGRRKKVFADRTELTGADGGPVKTADESSRAARAAQLLALARARKDVADLVGDDDTRAAWEDLV